MTEREGHFGREKFPTHQEIERRAYEIYLESGQEQGRAADHWFVAEEQLLWDRGLKTATIVVDQNGVSETAPKRDFGVAEEELSQVRASENLKEERDRSTAPRNKTVSGGQQKPR